MSSYYQGDNYHNYKEIISFLFPKWTANNRPSEGRLYNMPNGGKVGTWSSKVNDKSQWIQVDLGDVKRVTQVASQGQALFGYVQWVTKYSVSYSTLGKEFKSQDHVSNVGIMECMFQLWICILLIRK